MHAVTVHVDQRCGQCNNPYMAIQVMISLTFTHYSLSLSLFLCLDVSVCVRMCVGWASVFNGAWSTSWQLCKVTSVNSSHTYTQYIGRRHY